MPQNKMTVGFDYQAQSGDQTKNELLASLSSAGVAGHGISEQVRDPITGRLLQVVLTFPDTANAQAIDAVNANRGVATATPPIPPSLLSLDVTDINFSGVMPASVSPWGPSTHVVHAYADPNQSGAGAQIDQGGYILEDKVFVDGSVNNYPTYATATLLGLANASTVTDLTVNSGALELVHSAGSVPIILASPLIVPRITPYAGSNSNETLIWIDATGRAFPAWKYLNGVFVNSYTFLEAVAAGAL